jgi:flagellar FliL protein
VKETLVAGVLVTLIAAGAGVLQAQRLKPPPPISAQSDSAAPKAGEAGARKADEVIDMPPVVTNLRKPSDIWVRLEATLIYDPAVVHAPAVAAAQISGDFLAYLRTFSLDQFEGPTGLLNLKSDLRERAATRTGGGVKDVVIRTLVVQ